MEASPINVLYVLGRMQPGGIEVRLLDVMRRLDPEKFRLDVCALSGLSGSLDSDVRTLGGKVIRLPVKNLAFASRFTRLLRQNDYHVVHANIHYTAGMILCLAGRAGIPVRIANFHSIEDGRTSTLCRRAQRTAMRHLIDQYATDIVGCCETVLDQAWSKNWRSDSRCRPIYYGADGTDFERRGDRSSVRAELKVPMEAQVFLHLGRSSPEKNHLRLLAIFAQIRKIVPSAWLVIAGSGTDEARGVVARGIGDLGLQDRSIVLGARTDVPRLLEAADALLLPSLFEGLPNVVLEACAAGVPVLATDLGGVREIASRLSLVRYLPLSARDAEWAAVASQLSAEAERVQLRDMAADAFRASVFHLDRAAEAHRLLWSRAQVLGGLACS
jgi:glycosyltransferase involved in cell wall biosynthesis